jgi:perosamine synthetase
MSVSTQPAVLGGQPVRTKPYPAPNFIGSEERALVNQVLDSGVLSGFVAHHGAHFNGGPMVQALEAEICKTFGVKYAVTVNSATSGLHAAVCAALVGPGDEVIIPPYTMSATATMVACANGTPIFADIKPDTFCIDVDDVRRKITPRTKAIIAVNLFGGPAELEKLRAIADERKLALIEDNAQAPAGTRAGKLTGTYGNMAVLSFNCHKTVQCGEGGAVLTNDETLADRLRLVRNHGEVVQSQRDHVAPELFGLLGYNYRLTELQSAVALAQVRRLEELTVGRIEMANAMTEGLRGIDGITPPFVAQGDRHVYYLYAFKLDAKKFGLSRNQFKAALDAEGVSVADGYVRPIYLYPMYEARVRQQTRGLGAGIWHPVEGGQRYERGLCPVTERMHFEELLTTNICRADLTRDDAREFVRAIEKIYEHRRAVRDTLASRGIA